MTDSSAAGRTAPRPGPVVVTPEAVPLELEPATVGSRALAYALDLVIIGSGLLLLTLAQAAFGFGGFVPDWLGIALALLLVFAVLFGYPIGFETLRHGRTPGKMVLGLRVVTVEGGPVGLRHSTVRAILAPVELLGTLGAVALVSAFVSARGQRLGDLVAGTLVVREGRHRDAPAPATFAPPPGLEAYVARLDVGAVGREEYATVRDTLARLPELPPRVRERVAAQVAGGLRARVTPPPPGVSAEVWLACVAAAVQARRSGAGVPPPPPPAPGTTAPAAPSQPGPSGPTPGQPAPPVSPPPPPSPNSDGEPPESGFVPPA